MHIRTELIWRVALWTVVATAGSPITAGERANYSGAPCGKGQAESQGGSGGDGGQDNSDPIYLATGDFQHVLTDFAIPGRGLDFEIHRFYRSRSGLFSTFQDTTLYDGVLGSEPRDKSPLGINWDFNYNMRVDIKLYDNPVLLTDLEDPEPIYDFGVPGGIYLYTGTGRRDDFTAYTTHNPSTNNPGLFSNDQVSSVLVYTEHYNTIKLTDGDQVTYLFFGVADADGDPAPYGGRLASITDRNGNRIQFSYETSNGSERLSSAEDTLGHTIDFVYHDDPASPLSEVNVAYTSHLLWKIIDQAGRVTEYNYENPSASFQPRLISAKSPDIEDTTEFPLVFESGTSQVDHGRFPNGRTWEYEYAPAQPSADFPDGLLTKITDPNGVVITQNEYDGAVADKRRSGRVVRQQYGSDTYNYVVTDEFGGISDTGDTYDYYVWVNDRRGAVTRFKYARDRSSYSDPSGSPDTPRNRQLLEKVEFSGFLADADKRVWAVCDSQGTPTQWKYFDANGNAQDLASGPVPPAGQPSSYTSVWQPNRHWNDELVTRPNGDKVLIAYDDDADDPRRRDVMLSREVRSADGMESITEYWQYDFGFGGAGCGCGSQGFETAYKDGNGNVTFKVYDTTIDPLTGLATGNLLAVYYDLPPASSLSPTVTYAEANALAIERFAYNEWGQVVTHTHPSRLVVDENGNQTTQSRVDRFEYYTDTGDVANYGRLWRRRIDYGGFDLTTTFEYDLIGNQIKVTSPDGDVASYYFNQASELVREQRFDSTETVLFSQVDMFYDGNGNVVREDVLNLDSDQQVDPANPVITTVYEYDALDFPVAISREAGIFNGTVLEHPGPGRRAVAPVTNAAFASSMAEYDENRNLKKVLGGEAVNGNQSSNVIEYEYDARDLRGRVIFGGGSDVPLVREYTFDLNGRANGLTIDPDAVNQTQHFSVAYDAFDRLREFIDPMGNKLAVQYDSNHNPTSMVVCGPILVDTLAPSDPNQVLMREVYTYDGRDRNTAVKIEIFDLDYATGTSRSCASQAPASPPFEEYAYEYNHDSSVRTIKSSSGDPVEDRLLNVLYDTAGRVAAMFDNEANGVVNLYDAGSNLVLKHHFSTSQAGASFDLEYLVHFEHDAMDRRTAVIDGEGNRSEFEYDSRSNLVRFIDARGNLSEIVYDGMSRQIQQRRLLTDTGDGAGTLISGAAGEILTQYIFDASSRLIAEIDDNGHETSYEYDGLDRLLAVTLPDGGVYASVFDENGNVQEYTDARGVVVEQVFDLNNRLVSRTIDNSAINADPGPSAYASQESYTYDGLGRLRTATNDFSKVTREYDSRGNVVRETQNIAPPTFPVASDREVGYGFDTAGNMSAMTYPSGRQIHRAHDRLNRLVGVFNDAALADPVAEFEYVEFRLLNQINGNGTTVAMRYNGDENGANDAGDLGFGRLRLQVTGVTGSSTVLDSLEYTWDENQNRIGYDDLSPAMKNRRERTFGYDSVNRLIMSDVDFPNPMTDFASPTNSGTTTYTIDGVDNWVGVAGFEGNGTEVGVYTLDGDQAKNNQYTTSPREGGSEWSYDYDPNGNLIRRVQATLADFQPDYTINAFDLAAFLNAYNASDPSADLNGDGVFTFFDVQNFLDEFNTLSGTELEHWHYYYDHRNQLVQVSEELGVSVIQIVINHHDALSRRVVESIDVAGDDVVDAERQLLYGGTNQWEVIEQLDLLDSGNVLSTHVFGAGIDNEIGYRLGFLPGDEDIWTNRDDQGSVTSITNETGNVIERYEYGDYGQVQYLTPLGDQRSSSDYGIYHLYTGRPLIPGTALYDSRYRTLSAELGRFIQRDPMGHIDGLNVYAYTVNNPMTMCDPYGLWSAWRWLMTGDGNASDEVYEEAFTSYSTTVSDRVNGIGDSIGVDNLGPTDHTFDPEERRRAECWANCVGKKARDAVADAIADHFTGPVVAPFLNVDSSGGASLGAPSLLDGVQGVSYGVGGPIELFGWGGSITGDVMDRTNLGRQRGRHIRQGGNRFRGAAKKLKTPGNIASAIEAYIIMRDCKKECDECSTAY